MASSTLPAHLTCEYRINPVGIGVHQPRLSWKLQSGERGAKQTAYQIVVIETPDVSSPDVSSPDAQPDPHPIWDSGQINSDQSVHVAYAGPALRSGQRCYWRVRVWLALFPQLLKGAKGFFIGRCRIRPMGEVENNDIDTEPAQ